METGTVKFFNSNTDKRFGFIVPDGGERDVFFHHNGAREPQRPIHGFKEPGLIQTGKVRFPKQGDRVVFESEPSPKGPRARLWAFEEDYKRAQLASGIPSTDVNAPPHDGFTWNELEAVAGGIFGLMQSIPGASKELNLTNQQIGIFLRNTPDGKKGEELWKEFRRRQADKGSDEYTFITFMREVLSAAGHPITLIVVANGSRRSYPEREVEGAKPIFTLTEAKALLADSGRHTLADHAFGDAEVDWMKDGKQIAHGYFGRSLSVSIEETSERDATSFNEQAAAELRYCGKAAGYARNDSQD